MQHRQAEAARLCLKYLRSVKWDAAYSALADASKQQLEDCRLSALHSALTKSDYAEAERLLDSLGAIEHIFDEYLRKIPYTPHWTKLEHQLKPSVRGGHQMCIDVAVRRADC
jgi:hypothetical protein